MNDILSPEKLISRQDVAPLLNVSLTTLWRIENAGADIPKLSRLSNTILRNTYSDVLDYKKRNKSS